MADGAGAAKTSCEAVVAAADPPVFVVTTRAGDETAGCLVGFASQISIDPLRFLVGVSKKNHTFRVAARAPRLAVHLLGRREKALVELFGGQTEDGIDKFAHCRWRPGPDEVPILAAAAGWFSGPIIERHDFGDHVGMLIAPDSGADPRGEVEAMRLSMVQDVRPGHEA